MVVSVVVLGVGLTTAVEVVQWSAVEHRAAQQKHCALEAATTILDRLTVADWSAVTQARADQIRLPDDTVRFLVDPRLTVSIVPQNQTRRQKQTVPQNEGSRPLAKRITVEIAWAAAHHTSGANQNVRLTTWVFRPGGGK